MFLAIRPTDQLSLPPRIAGRMLCTVPRAQLFATPPPPPKADVLKRASSHTRTPSVPQRFSIHYITTRGFTGCRAPLRSLCRHHLKNSFRRIWPARHRVVHIITITELNKHLMSLAARQRRRARASRRTIAGTSERGRARSRTRLRLFPANGDNKGQRCRRGRRAPRTGATHQARRGRRTDEIER